MSKWNRKQNEYYDDSLRFSFLLPAFPTAIQTLQCYLYVYGGGYYYSEDELKMTNDPICDWENFCLPTPQISHSIHTIVLLCMVTHQLFICVNKSTKCWYPVLYSPVLWSMGTFFAVICVFLSWSHACFLLTQLLHMRFITIFPKRWA